MEYRIGRSRHTKRGSVAEIIGNDLIAGCHPNMSAPHLPRKELCLDRNAAALPLAMLLLRLRQPSDRRLQG